MKTVNARPMKSLTISREQKSNILKCNDYSKLILWKKGDSMFLDVSKLVEHYKNGYRPINEDWWLGMRMCHDLVDLELTDADKLVELKVHDEQTS